MGQHRQQRTALGDRQAGEVTRTTKGVEAGADYQLHARGGDKTKPITMATHHMNGLSDQGAITETLDDAGLKRYRDHLKAAGYYLGNQLNNYTGLFDGALSDKAVGNRGIYSYDHKDVHDKIDKEYKSIGYDPKKKTYNGIPIDKLPEQMKTALGMQISFISENAVDDVNRQRGKTLREAFPDDTYEQRKARILDNPQSFASIDHQNRPIPDKHKASVTGQPPVPKPKIPTRKALKALAIAGLAAPTVVGTAASAAETTGRTQLAMNSGDVADWLQAGISAASLAADPVPVVGEFISTPADLTNVLIDQHREGGSTHTGSGRGGGTGNLKIGTNNGPRGRSGAQRDKRKKKTK